MFVTKVVSERSQGSLVAENCKYDIFKVRQF